MTDAERECRIEAAADEDRWRREAEEERRERDYDALFLSIECFNDRCDRCWASDCQCPCHNRTF